MAAADFSIRPASRRNKRITAGLFGPSGCGKTYTALELATGMRDVFGGKIVVIDTEDGRSEDYADFFDFSVVNFAPPFSSLRYLDAFRYAVAQGGTIIIGDSMSHEHEGEGGLLDYHAAEVERLAGGQDWKREAVKMLAWGNPKRDRRKLRAEVARFPGHLILCFRAKEGAKPVKGWDAEKQKEVTSVVQTGFQPIAGDEFVYEMKISALLLPASQGVPTWHSDFVSERQMIKLPRQFRDYFEKRAETHLPLDRECGKYLATWARGEGSTGGASAVASGTNAPDPSRREPAGRSDADAGPCWKPVAGSRCKLAEGHDGRCVPEPPANR